MYIARLCRVDGPAMQEDLRTVCTELLSFAGVLPGGGLLLPQRRPARAIPGGSVPGSGYIWRRGPSDAPGLRGFPCEDLL